jgi:hypothetical protein
MTTMIEVYKGHQLTAVEQRPSGWAVEIVPIGGGGKPWLTQTAADQDRAMASARRMLDNGVRA